MQTKKKQKTLTFRQAEAMTGISNWTWRNWKYQRKIRVFKTGPHVQIPISEVQRMVDQVLARNAARCAHIRRPKLQELGA